MRRNSTNSDYLELQQCKESTAQQGIDSDCAAFALNSILVMKTYGNVRLGTLTARAESIERTTSNGIASVVIRRITFVDICVAKSP